MSGLPEKLKSPYKPDQTEGRIYDLWEKSGYFNPDNLPGNPTEPFTIIMPPPNANGHLHVGHTLFITLEDIMTRVARMRGKRALWVPGADHAGFETQIVYEKKLEKEGRSRFGMDPKQLYEEIMAFTLENKSHMEAEVKAMGASCDWSREKFTLDPDIVTEVQKTFQKMYEDDLVYRGKRIINWCAKHQTSLSEVETEFIEKTEPFYYFQYGPFVIATSRPETKFGDKYVVMHPEDKRYADYQHGQKIDLEWINGPITATVIKDEAIDMEFGTGVMTITPWHDAVDFEIAERHGLEKEQIIDERGKLLPIAGEFAGMKIAEARPKIIEKLAGKGLLVKTDEKYQHNVKVCYKCQNPIEPQIREQWFVKMKPLAQKAVEAVNAGKIKFVPDNFRKIFLYWMENTIDWNISRQIVWGIPIPAKICEACGEGVPDLDDSIKSCLKCGGTVRSDTDTFDTWFSSGQWPHLVLGYPDSSDFKTFYPTDIMETGHDLIFKWVPRMVIFGLYSTGEVPFHTVYMHGLVNDAQGKKMSKSKGNVINPLEIATEFGTDALRMALIVGNTPGTDMALAKDKIKAYKHFANKLWNITRFVLEGTEEVSDESLLTDADKKHLEKLNELIASVTGHFDNHRYHLAAEELYQYAWHELADKLLEESKPILRDGTEAEKTSRSALLRMILRRIIILIHPFMPFVTEEIWGMIKNESDDLLIVTAWPKS